MYIAESNEVRADTALIYLKALDSTDRSLLNLF